MHFSVNESKRYLITLHLSLNDLLRRSVDLMRSAYTNHSHDSIKIIRSFIILHNSFFTELVEQETKLTIKTKTKFAAAFERQRLELVFVASPRSIKEKEQRIRILYPSGVTCLSNYNTGNNAFLRK
jgi:ABC-type uncharacterized transport system substrate-binding protein